MPSVSAMRPASIGVAPPPCENTHLMSVSREIVPLDSRLTMARVESKGYSTACGMMPGRMEPQQAATVG